MMQTRNVCTALALRSSACWPTLQHLSLIYQPTCAVCVSLLWFSCGESQADLKCLQIIVAWQHFHLSHLLQTLKMGMLQCRLRFLGHCDKAHQAGCRCECQGFDTVHTSAECSSWHILCLGNHACKWLSGRCVRCAFAPCLACTRPYSRLIQPIHAKQCLSGICISGRWLPPCVAHVSLF